MAFGVFIHRSDSIYDDRPAERYQFPAQYLGRVKGCVGDWVIYYEPRKVLGTRGYFAVAKVREVLPDPGVPNMHLALIEPGSYLDFPNPVPFSEAGGVIERGLLNDDGRISGRAQSAVRPISPADFHRIVELGLAEDKASSPRGDMHSSIPGFREDGTPFQYEQERDRVSSLMSRVLRDRVFRRVVLQAYDSRCAVTGLRLINGGGRAEVEAAHIRPVEANGPDIVSNGLALSGTAHWMFDRGLISVADDLQILISRHVNDADSVRGMINKSGRILRPNSNRLSDRPHPYFLSWHRDNRFKA
ncbi:HNH endonuclease [Bradyrhizobium sp.]|jgi:putative restriction endonuclease|uniref:HNH endonuclease n=1 Tax=Bradyrhizobium sp. TaxID=376 RepID=UPI003C29E4B3